MNKVKQIKRKMRKTGITEYVILERHIYRYEVECERNCRKSERYQRYSKYLVLVCNRKNSYLPVKVFSLYGNEGMEEIQEEYVIYSGRWEGNIDDNLSVQAEEVIKKESDIFEDAVYASIGVQIVCDKILWEQGREKIYCQRPKYKFDIAVVHKPNKTFEMEQRCSGKVRRNLEIELNEMRRNLKCLSKAEIVQLEGMYPVVFSEDVLKEMRIQSEKRVRKKAEMCFDEDIVKSTRIYIHKLLGLRVSENGSYSGIIMLGAYKQNGKVTYFTRSMIRGNIGKAVACIWAIR